MASNYWQKRDAERNRIAALTLKNKKALLTETKRHMETMKNLFLVSRKRIEKRVFDFYEKYAKEEGLTLAEAKAYLSSKETQLTLDEYKKLTAEALRGSARADKILKAAEARRKISRLDALRLQLDGEILNAGSDTQRLIESSLLSTGRSAYLRKMFEIDSARGYGRPFTTLSNTDLKALAKERWVDNKGWSSRLWGHVRNLEKQVNVLLTHAVTAGEPAETLAKELSGRTGVAISRCKTLMRTEAAHISEQASLQSYKEADVEQYRYLATLDNRTSEICIALDDMVFFTDAAETGINYPPMHPNCRSTTVPDYTALEKQMQEEYGIALDDSGISRAARGQDGKTYEVPASMTYREWKAAHGQGGEPFRTKNTAQRTSQSTSQEPAQAAEKTVYTPEKTGYNNTGNSSAGRDLAQQHEAYTGYLGTWTEEDTDKKLQAIQAAGAMWLLDGFITAVDKGDISVLIGIDYYMETAKEVEEKLIGVTTDAGIEITGYTTHFIDRVIGQMAEPREGIRIGVSVKDALDTLQNGKSEPAAKNRDGDMRQSIFGKTSRVMIDPTTGDLVQVNPRSSKIQ